MISGMLAIIVSEMLATIIARSVSNYSFQICWQLQIPEILAKNVSEMSNLHLFSEKTGDKCLQLYWSVMATNVTNYDFQKC